MSDMNKPLVALVERWSEDTFALPQEATQSRFLGELEAALQAQRAAFLREATRDKSDPYSDKAEGYREGLLRAAEMLEP